MVLHTMQVPALRSVVTVTTTITTNAMTATLLMVMVVPNTVKLSVATLAVVVATTQQELTPAPKLAEMVYSWEIILAMMVI